MTNVPRGNTALAIDLFAGCFGWSAGWLELGGRVVGFDLEHCDYHGPVPRGADLILQDVRTIDGARFKDASLILASSPCQEFSYRAMPWKKAKALGSPELGLELFAQAFRIQQEAIEASSCWECEDWHVTAYCEACKGTRRRFIPMVQENVRGANPWVREQFGRSRWSYGSYHLWGDVPALMPITSGRSVMKQGITHRSNGATNFHGKPSEGFKTTGLDWSNRELRGQDFTRIAAMQADEGVKQGGDWFDDPKSMSRRSSSKSSARRAASARIAKIPIALSRHIASVYFPPTP